MAGPVVLLAELVEVLAERVPSTDWRLDSEAQAQHRAAAAAVAVHLVSLTTLAVVELVRRVGSCSRIRQQQATGDDEQSSRGESCYLQNSLQPRRSISGRLSTRQVRSILAS
jgi:hypothetical protein